MKKFSFFLAVVLLVLFGACEFTVKDDSDDDSTPIQIDMTGTWELASELEDGSVQKSKIILTQNDSNEVSLKFSSTGDIKGVSGTIIGSTGTLTFTFKFGGNIMDADYDVIIPATYTFESSTTLTMGSQSMDFTTTFTRLSESTDIPTTTLPIADIEVDGSADDWSDVAIFSDDETGDYETGAPEGSDIDYVKLAVSSDGEELYFLIKLANGVTADPDTKYRIPFANYDMTTGTRGDDIEIEISVHGGEGWYMNVPGSDGSIEILYDIESSNYIEGSALLEDLIDVDNNNDPLSSPFIIDNKIDAKTEVDNESLGDETFFFGLIYFP